MLYLGIDQHARQITISRRDENGDVPMARQVSTQPTRINEFFTRLTRERLKKNESFIAVLEVCGFNESLIRMLNGRLMQLELLLDLPPLSSARSVRGANRCLAHARLAEELAQGGYGDFAELQGGDLPDGGVH